MESPVNEGSLASQDYDETRIKILHGLDGVKKRPGMYIGNVHNGDGLHHLIYEVVDNGVDEALEKHADKIQVTLHDDNSVSVSDNGRGIPVGIIEEEGYSAVEVIMTNMHSGGKFDSNSYKVSGGTHGVGVSVVNALSDWLEVRVRREGFLHFVRFVDSVAEEPLKAVRNCGMDTGTHVRFLPAINQFGRLDYSWERLEARFRELAFLNSGLQIRLRDERGDEVRQAGFHSQGGVSEFVSWLDKARKPLLDQPIRMTGLVGKVEIDIALWWTTSLSEVIKAYTNNIPQIDGGTHVAGFRSALTRSVKKYCAEYGQAKIARMKLSGDDIREGLTCVISIGRPEPDFSSQTKDKLVSTDVQTAVSSLVAERLTAWLRQNPRQSKVILNKIALAAEAREAARKSRDLVLKRSATEIASLPGKLADCQEKSPELAELFIVEGDSAGGSAKQGRARGFQAILPLRGKILNVERKRMNAILGNEQIGTLIKALGAGIGRDEFDIDKLRYHKVVIMTDADVDGAHIRTLLLTFFFRQMPKIIESGFLYIAQPPLFKVERGNVSSYLKDMDALNDFLTSQGADGALLRLGSGEQIAGGDLVRIVQEARAADKLLEAFRPAHWIPAIEHAAIAGVLEPGWLSTRPQQAADRVATRMDMAALEYEKGWIGRPQQDGGLVFRRTVRGIEEMRVLRPLVVRSHAGRKLAEMSDALSQVYFKPATFEHRQYTAMVHTPSELLQAVLDVGRKGLTVQRYKGLGEMNPEQLWETTLDPDERVLLRVRVDDVAKANDMFVKLMGAEVLPRKEFIMQNALNASNLSV